MRNTKRSLMVSAISLLLCFSMLLSTTYAWFTATATSKNNVIQSGNLDVEMYWSETLLAPESSEWQDADGDAIFTYDNWEPGYTDVKYIKVKNAGNLSLKWKLTIEAEGRMNSLAEVIDVYYINPVTETVDTLPTSGKVGLLKDVVNDRTATEGVLLPTGEVSTEYTVGETILAVAFHMHEDAGNEYQGKSVGKGFSVNLIATQFAYESDDFGNQYDKDSVWPDNVIVDGNTASAPVTPDASGNNPSLLSLRSEDGKMSASVPAGVKLDPSASKLTLTLKDVKDSQANVTLTATEAALSVDVHIDGVSADNDVVMAIYVKELLPVGLNMGNYRFYHVENGNTVEMTLLADGATPVHNNYEYDPATGDVVLHLKSFSEVALVADTENAWAGKFDYNWYDASKTELEIANADQLAAFGAIVGGMNGKTKDSFTGKTVKLLADVNIGDKEKENNPDLIFYPIGYYNSIGSYEKASGGSVTSSVSSFEGTFDGNGNTIANFYQNTWEMFGDYNSGYTGTPNHYKDAMGLFGYVLNGTVKNLTVDNFSSDGEYTPTGVIAAYVDGNSTFENIAITNCNPRVYNTGNGGIIGIAGDTSKANDDHITLRNITVDNSNKISALWGSWDVACGGLVGMYRGNVDGSGNATGDTITFTNCHVSAQIDVYNDVCANYQYYAYRYSGMIIGSVRHNTTNEDGRTIPNMTGISATGCTVNYGDWNDYYYCEFEKNTMASYSEDYQFSRVPHSELNFTDSNGNGLVDADERSSVTGCKHEHTAEENHQAIYLPFHQLFTGYSWGVSSIGLEKYSGVVTNLDITEGDQQESAVKFETKFTGDFLYRVGNANTVSIGSLFAAALKLDANGEKQYDENGELIYWAINSAGVWVKVEKLDENMNVEGTFTANTTDWTKGTIQFSGTGVVKVTIQDYNFCTPTVLMLEVVDAYNATSAVSATANNVVLLNDISGTFVVSNSYTFYGNGFTVTLPTTSVQEQGQGYTGYISIGAAQDSGVANGGNLDNVRIEGPVFPEMYLYRSQAVIKDKNDPDYGNGSNMRYFRNSVIVYGGNVTISNCYISGSRTALCLRGGNNVVIENTTLSGGSYANMQICSGSSVTLRNLTTVQTDVADSYGKGKTAYGMGIAVDSAVVDIYIEGELNQYNWINETKWDSIVGNYAPYFPKFFTDNNFKNNWHYLNEGKDPYVNLGFIFACNWDTSKIHDNRTTVDYATTKASISSESGTVNGGVYTKVNTVGDNAITNADFTVPEYKSSGFNPIAPSLNFDNTANNDDDDLNDAQDTYCVYNESNGILRIGVSEDSKTLDLSGVTVTKNGVVLTHTAYLNGIEINGNSVTIKSADGAKQTLMFKATSNDAGYDKDGNPVAGTIEYTWTVTIEIAVLSYPKPEWNMGKDYEFAATANGLYAYYGTSNGYGEAVQIYEGIKVVYYDKNGNRIEKDFSGTTAIPTGSNNSNSNAFTYTLSDGSTLTMKFSSGWKSGATTHQFTKYEDKVYIYPQSLDNDNYIRAKTTNQDFDVKISYTFTDPNGQSITQTMRWYNAMGTNGNVRTVQWKDFDPTNGKTSCITPDTLITLADGTQVRVDSLTGSEELLVWNMETGMLDKAPIMFVDSDPTAEYEIIHLYFSDGTDVKVIYEHGFWDYDLNKYVYLDRNAADYIGHTFAKQNGDSLEKVQLVNVVIETELTEAWSPVTAGHLCYFVNGMLSMPGGVGGLFNIFDVDAETMTYDYEAMMRDIELYGLYTYEELNAICPLSEEMFIAAGGAYLKISIAKGNLTEEELFEMINRYSKFFE